MKNASVAVLNLLLIVLYQSLIIDKKLDCYGTKRWVKLLGFVCVDLSYSGLLLHFNSLESRLLVINLKIIYKEVKGLLVKVKRLSCAAFRLLDLFQVAWREAKKAKSLTAHNYKKCDRQVLEGNKINNLQSQMIMKSVVRFGLRDCLFGDPASGTHPPMKRNGRQAGCHYLLLVIYCKDFTRGFYKVIGQGFDFIGVFSFRKVGGRGE